MEPEYLDDRGKWMWNYVATQAEKAGADVMDSPLLEVVCSAWSMYHWARETVKREGAVIPTVQGGKIPHPAIQIGKRSGETVQRILHEFGMTPKAKRAKPKESTKTIADLLE